MSLLKVLHPDIQYRVLVKHIIKYGDFKTGRNGNTLSSFGNKMTFCLRDNKVPFLSTKKLAWRSCLRELLWFMKGSTDNRILTDDKVTIWNGNADRDFLKSRGLNYSIDGDLGPIYGHQWRHFNATYDNCETDYTGKGVDQLQQIVNSLKDDNEKFSRRLILSAWNPEQLNEMALPPCHVMSQFYVTPNNELSCMLFQRSGDVGLGVPFNIASYSILTHLIAKHCGLEAKEFVYFLGNAHIYDDHLEPLKEQMMRSPLPFPKLEILQTRLNIDDYTADDFKLLDYQYHKKIKMEMRK